MSTVDSFCIGKKPVLEMKIGNSTFYKTPGWDSFSGGLRLTKKASLNIGRLLGSDKKGHLIWYPRTENNLYITDNEGSNKKVVAGMGPVANVGIERNSGLIVFPNKSKTATFLLDTETCTTKQMDYVAFNGYLNLASSSDKGTLFGADKASLYLITDINKDTPQIKSFRSKELNKNYFLGVSFYGGYFYLLACTPDSDSHFYNPCYLHKLNASGDVVASKKLDNLISSPANTYYVTPSVYDDAGSIYISLIASSSNYHNFFKVTTDGTPIIASEPRADGRSSDAYPFTVNKYGSAFIIRDYRDGSWKTELYTYSNNLSKSSSTSLYGGTYYIESLSDGRILLQKESSQNDGTYKYDEYYYEEALN